MADQLFCAKRLDWDVPRYRSPDPRPTSIIHSLDLAFSILQPQGKRAVDISLVQKNTSPKGETKMHTTIPQAKICAKQGSSRLCDMETRHSNNNISICY